MKNEDNNMSDIIYAIFATAKDIVYEIKRLREKKDTIDDIKIKLAVSGVVTCPNCGAAFDEYASKCSYCGYISVERDTKLENFRRAKRGLDSQIKQEQNQLKKVIMILLMIIILLFICIFSIFMIEMVWSIVACM